MPRTLWERLPADLRSEITYGMPLQLTKNYRQWVMRRVEVFKPLDLDTYSNRVSLQIEISAELFDP